MSEADAATAASGEALPQDDQTTTADTSSDNGDIEARAKRMGWVPKETFRGDPNRWSPAEAYVERAEREMPILLERFRSLDDRYARTERELGATRGKLDDVSRVLVEFRDFASKSEERSYQRARRELEAKRDEAVLNADVATHRAVTAEMAELDKSVRPHEPAPQAQQQQQPAGQIYPETAAWIEANPWFRSDQELNEEATFIHGKLLRNKPGLSLSDNLAEVKKEIKRRYPEKFGRTENERRAAPSAVAAPGAPAQRTGAKKGRGYDDLPADAKAACDRFVKTMPLDKAGKPYTREMYLKSYFGDQA